MVIINLRQIQPFYLPICKLGLLTYCIYIFWHILTETKVKTNLPFDSIIFVSVKYANQTWLKVCAHFCSFWYHLFLILGRYFVRTVTVRGFVLDVPNLHGLFD